VDLGRKLIFPGVVQTNLRPDILIWSEEKKKLYWEEKYQQAKYTELVD